MTTLICWLALAYSEIKPLFHMSQRFVVAAISQDSFGTIISCTRLTTKLPVITKLYTVGSSLNHG